MKGLLSITILLALSGGCSGPGDPGETVSAFMENVKSGDLDAAREYLARDQWDELEEFCEGKTLLSFYIGDVSISRDGNSATVEWSTEIDDVNSPDNNEGGDFQLEKNQERGWVITGL
ncbi:MAG: DUF4878 domain-containing protein [Candidatus Aegiribacteria sp.]|nr:DUF4878 domain-containing protein [Candidatus Aegiribacteria sp.]MBD3294105.1 DUF4878 domain-containing protein [Candidatus Fermentibacteria bacterium]